MVDISWSPVEYQQMIINILTKMTPEENTVIFNRVYNNDKVSADMKEYIYLCISFANEQRKFPEYGNTIDNVCKSILARQKSKNINEIKKNEYVQAFGWKNGVKLNRIEHGKAIMDYDNIRQLCSGFRKAIDSRFWENKLLSFYPDTVIYPSLCKPDCEKTPTSEDEHKIPDTLEQETFFMLMNSIDEPLKSRIESGMTDEEKEKISILIGNEKRDLSKMLGDETPFRLYAVIAELVAKTPGMTIQLLVEEELMTSTNSWYAWKIKWEKAEQVKFAYMPKPRLQRRYLLIMAIVFKLTYLETLVLLQLAGYRIGTDEIDKRVVDYILRGVGEEEVIKLELLNNTNLYTVSRPGKIK